MSTKYHQVKYYLSAVAAVPQPPHRYDTEQKIQPTRTPKKLVTPAGYPNTPYALSSLKTVTAPPTIYNPPIPLFSRDTPATNPNHTDQIYAKDSHQLGFLLRYAKPSDTFTLLSSTGTQPVLAEKLIAIINRSSDIDAIIVSSAFSKRVQDGLNDLIGRYR